jgi:hypothetical protein
MKFNALNIQILLHLIYFLKSAKTSALIAKESTGAIIAEVGKEGLEEYVNDLGGLYG